MFGRSALALAAPVQGSIFFRGPLLVSPTLKVCGVGFAFSQLAFWSWRCFCGRLFLFWVGLVQLAVA